MPPSHGRAGAARRPRPEPRTSAASPRKSATLRPNASAPAPPKTDPAVVTAPRAPTDLPLARLRHDAECRELGGPPGAPTDLPLAERRGLAATRGGFGAPRAPAGFL